MAFRVIVAGLGASESMRKARADEECQVAAWVDTDARVLGSRQIPGPFLEGFSQPSAVG